MGRAGILICEDQSLPDWYNKKLLREHGDQTLPSDWAHILHVTKYSFTHMVVASLIKII